LSIENNSTAWTSSYDLGDEIVIPLKNGEGSFQCDDATLAKLEGEELIVARYVGENPNGSRNMIAGITNELGNVVGLMPHPEHAIDPLTGPSADGLGFFTSILSQMVSK
jgi:phosphoribosylformylglycinamidine synthase